jgi:hypothetical protein
MAELQGQIGEVRMTLEIKRAATGKTETVEVIGKVIDDECNPLDSGEERRD